MTTSELWKATLGELETTLSPATFKTVFAPASISSATEDSLEILINNPYMIEQIKKKFMGLILNVFDKQKMSHVKLTFKVGDVEKTKDTKQDKPGALPLFPKTETRGKFEASQGGGEGLIEKYTFETFIVGPSNRLAHAMATAIVDNPGKVYNPFFLHAGVGLGKTHLIQAIGNEILKRSPSMRVVYATAESFMNELIETIQEGRTKKYTANKFRDKFRKADVLLIDDIQFIAGRGEATQEEFFHTFNALYMAQKQIVLTSDRPPKELSKLDVRITSRFASGVVADMQKPGLETRSAILREKRDVLKADISNAVIDFIAESVETNIRELEGALLQIITQAKAEGEAVTKEFSAKVLGKALTNTSNLNIHEVLKTICTYYGIKMVDLKGPSRVKEFVVPRQISMYLLKQYTATPYMAIGDLLGNRDHTTVMHGALKIESELTNDHKLKQDVYNIKKSLHIDLE